jgi:acetylornithine deacetylase/succinyl-diaminopimelate desuccinylase-like protein
MIFVRHNGVSHNPEEHVEDESIEKALKLFHKFMLKVLSQGEIK